MPAAEFASSTGFPTETAGCLQPQRSKLGRPCSLLHGRESQLPSPFPLWSLPPPAFLRPGFSPLKQPVRPQQACKGSDSEPFFFFLVVGGGEVRESLLASVRGLKRFVPCIPGLCQAPLVPWKSRFLGLGRSKGKKAPMRRKVLP